MELVQKEEGSHTPVAKASAKCWSNTWAFVRRHFERVTGQSMRPGMKVLLKVTANFHEAYGFSWIVTDVHPEFTMGDMARRRSEEHTSELQSRQYLVCRLLLEKHTARRAVRRPGRTVPDR